MIKVLIVEDEAGIRSSLANAYSWSEMECELLGCAASGIEALEICLKVQPDIIISDIVMPGIDGLTFLKYIKDKYPEIQFIILTGHRNFDYAKDALNIGASYFMLKPINYEELKENICRLASQIVNSNEERETENKQEQVLRRLLNGHVYKKSIFILWIVFDIIRFIVNIKKFTGTKYLQIMAVISQIYIFYSGNTTYRIILPTKDHFIIGTCSF